MYKRQSDERAPAADARVRTARGLQASLFKLLSELDLPEFGPLDQLLHELGGASAVAEMTGRKKRLVRDAQTGKVRAEKRNAGAACSMEAVNLTERAAFMDGTKRVAIISEAASSGISLQADRRVPSAHMQRVHITLELPWSSACARARHRFCSRGGFAPPPAPVCERARARVPTD